MKWETHSSPERVGKLCYYLCSPKSNLPIRDVLNDHGKDNKLEPNYETATYNWCAMCNQRSVHAAVKDRLSHILFVTRYTGRNSEYCDRCLEEHDVIDDYLREVGRLKAEYNPFREILNGRIFIINVGANASSALQSPLFDVKRFEFVSIPEHDPPDSDQFLTYADLRQFYEPSLRNFQRNSQFPTLPLCRSFQP